MKNLNKLVSECERELNAIGITIGNVVDYSVNTRAKSRWGQTKYKTSTKTYTINIASALMQDDIPVRATKDTIIHEMLHTCPGCFNHGKEWQALANKVNTAYGYNVKCASSCKDKGVSENVMQSTRREETTHYILRCERCNAHWEYSRHSKIVQCAERGNAKCGCGCKSISVTHI